MFDLKVSGAQDFARVSRACKDAGDKSLNREVFRALGSAGKEMTPLVLKAMPSYLPDRYAADVAGSLKVRVRSRRSARNPSVFLVGQAKSNKGQRRLGGLEKGSLRHRTWGRNPWHEQKIRSGFWSEPLTKGAVAVRKELVHALERIAQMVTH